VSAARSLLPRGGEETHLGTVRIDRLKRRASVGGEELYLSEREFGLLAALAADPRKTLTYEQLEAELFVKAPRGSRRLLDAAAVRLRRKLELRGAEALIAPIHGVGFRFFASAEASAPAEREPAGPGGAL
jgi:DNA-binding response OmpR family regulator